MLHIIRAVFLIVVLAITITFAFQSTESSTTSDDSAKPKVEKKLEPAESDVATTQPAAEAKKIKAGRAEDGKTPETRYEVIDRGPQYVTLYILAPALAACLLILVDMFWRRKRLNILGGLFFGLVAGLAIAYVITLIFDMVTSVFPELAASPVLPLIKWLLGAMAIFLCVTIVMQTRDEFRFIIPYVEFSKQAKGNQPMLLDTSVIIDGRIADIVDTSIFQGELIVPRFVLAELQTIADSEDKLKRNRGRRGLDILQSLQKNEKGDINILEVHVPSVENAPDVDAKLVALAEHLNGRVVTNDYNLNKVAHLRGIEVININDLANALKPVVLPGETMKVKIIKPGEEPGQGVGYLDDGTMIVADQGRSYLNKEITITITSVLQTSAGRMIFGKADGNEDDPTRSRQKG